MLRTSSRRDCVGVVAEACPYRTLWKTINVKVVKPPSSSPMASTVVFIGRNARGNWVARQQHGMFGGLFVNRAQAFKYALFDHRRGVARDRTGYSLRQLTDR